VFSYFLDYQANPIIIQRVAFAFGGRDRHEGQRIDVRVRECCAKPLR
jgi:hypothetical protein